jgi:hemerythrin superfamily protein
MTTLSARQVSKRKRTTRRQAENAKSATTPPNAIALLKADHAEFKRMHKRYEKLVEQKAGQEERQTLAMQICRALSIHATLEEELFYPAVKRASKKTRLVDHADVEHAIAKHVLKQIESLETDDAHFDATVCVLCEYVAHHIKEEEGEMFPLVQRLKLDTKQLGVKMRERRTQLAEEDDPVG